ncbi:3736_t:CDS:1, partial [Acaulospora colombiana]
AVTSTTPTMSKGNANNGDGVPGYFFILENGFGLVGTAFWSFQLVPQ